jgi:hypothetical protein
MTIWIAMLGLATAQCEGDVSIILWGESLKQSRESFEFMDQEGFQEHRQKAIMDLPCLSSPVNATQVAHFYQIQALNSFLVRDLSSMGYFIEAATAADPQLPFPIEGFPTTHPLRQYVSYSSVQPPAPPVKLSRPLRGMVHVDGHVSQEAPTDRPYIFQYVDENGDLQTTTMIGLGGMPDYPKWSGGGEYPMKLQPYLAMGAAGTAIMSLGTAWWARRAQSRFWDPDLQLDEQELRTIRLKTNLLSGGSVIFGTASAGMLVSAVVTGAW